MKAPSARGLFRATGKTARPVAVRDEETGEYAKVAERPRKRTGSSRRPRRRRKRSAPEIDRLRGRKIWEPAAGDGAMLRVFAAFGLDVVASDLVDRGCGATVRSFFDFAAPPAHAIVTNPPFHESSWGHGKARWIGHALDRLGVDYMALLMPFNWCGAGGLGPLWSRRPPARVYLMRWRLDFTGQGAQPALHAWYVWDGPTAEGDTRLLMLDRVVLGQGALFGGEPLEGGS
ncbi:hypothetical protein [Chenggangzhangella methanolivorans]|uniref:SAM-dependent methyltransferase n=1 Tax=Chenggangzhangella methanolivorans TaxID=1437009 RepID=A0A9E6UKT6_9HYPH|nr:hypothetical protein [Chenggangzhangella methanolivorans]QZN99776.1 hypothetical protein K6K41_24455 [Chenggangzhangella methanolivorans]